MEVRQEDEVRRCEEVEDAIMERNVLKKGLESSQKTNETQNGPFNSDVMPNGNGPTDGFDAAGDTLPNGSPPPGIDSQSQESSPANQKPLLEMENEEKIRLEARRRLEEQLKQYRVQRQKERAHRPSTKSRPFSTLDPELMLHPEALPRANTVAMTKEYSFLRTSVPRGPKLGSLGIPPPKEKKSRSPRPSKIHSLAD